MAYPLLSLSLKLGTLTTIVISSPNVAKQMFTNHDSSFSGRKIPDAIKVFDHHKHSIVWLPVCPKWRDLRKVAVVQLFTSHRLDLSQGLRQKKFEELVEHVQNFCEKGKVVRVSNAAFTTTLNLLSNTFFSVDFGSHDSEDLQEFKDIDWALMELSATPNVSDFFSVVRRFDLQGVFVGRTGRLFAKMIAVFDGIIEERLRDRFATKDDVLGVLLKLVEDNALSI